MEGREGEEGRRGEGEREGGRKREGGREDSRRGGERESGKGKQSQVMHKIEARGQLSSPLSGMVSRAATALMADLFSSSCFSYSCLTELAFALDCMVDLNGSINFSTPSTVHVEKRELTNRQVQCQYL